VGKKQGQTTAARPNHNRKAKPQPQGQTTAARPNHNQTKT
jgi:hypothetical protein